MTSEPALSTADFILASASPRRRQLLQQIGARFLVDAVNVDETPQPGEAPGDYVLRLARHKAEAGRRATAGVGLPVLAADTSVVLDGQIIGKPAAAAEAVAMLLRLSGRCHQVLTGVALATAAGTETRLSRTLVQLCPLTEADCRAYWATGEPADKAGAYAIQGYGAVFVTHIEGSYSGVVGLPLAETTELLKWAGIDVWQSASQLTGEQSDE